MSESSRVVLRLLPAAALAVLAACHTPTARTPAPDRAPVPKPLVPVDASYDWHVLLIAPFGSVLKDIPVALHEVLLFRDEANRAAADDAECYGPDSAAPPFVGHAPDEYLLCFKHDRLSRIQASVRLTAAQAPEVFAAACAGWLQRAAGTGAADTVATGPVPGSCEGSEGAARFSARLGEEADRSEQSEAQMSLSIVIDSVSDP